MSSGITRSRSGRLRIVWALVVALAAAPGLSASVQARGSDAAEARRHAQRASNLAASGKCRQAVAEWNKALGILRDPALLFNRAECYRKLGEADAALEDYRQFLKDLPKAPNRGEVERRITELSGQKDKERDRDKAKETAPPPPPAPVVVAPPPLPVPSAARPAAPESAPPEDVAPPAPLPAAPAERVPAPALTLTAPVEATSSSGSADGGITTRPWFWITVAAVAVAAGVGTFILLSRDSTTIPSTALGNYKL